MAIQCPKGMKDVLPQESYKWQYIEALARQAAGKAGFREIRTPVLEHTELFLRGVGDTTDVVQKEMYTFTDKGGRSVTLKPEGTAGAVRALIESGLAAEAMPQKLYYLNCPVFRYENPQAGRLREHHQFGIEAFGAASPYMDAEVISVAMDFCTKLGLKDLSLTINSIGCHNCRPKYQQALRDYLRPHLPQMCQTCRDRFERNPLRILDCKEEACKAINENAPSVLDVLCQDCRAHFDKLQLLLERLGYTYKVDPRIVRGLDYYTRTVFEVITLVDGKPLTVCGGGRYDALVKTLGGPELPGIGFGLGLERALMVAQAQGVEFPCAALEALVLCAGDEARDAAFDLAHKLRDKGVRADSDTMGRSLKAQLKYSGKISVPYVVIIGQEELDTGKYKLRDMSKSSETILTYDELIAFFERR